LPVVSLVQEVAARVREAMVREAKKKEREVMR
jgi:hypothetical protein